MSLKAHDLVVVMLFVVFDCGSPSFSVVTHRLAPFAPGSLHSDVEDHGDETDEDDDEFGGPRPGDDGLGPVAAKNFFEDKRDEFGTSKAVAVQDEGEEQQSARFKAMQFMHRTILNLHVEVENLRRERKDLYNRVDELLQRKGLK